MTAEEITREIETATDEQNILFRDLGAFGLDLGLYNGTYRVVIHRPGNWHDQVISVTSPIRWIIVEETLRLFNKYKES